jgi:carboxylesterase
MGDLPIRPGAEPFSLGSGDIGVLMVHGFTGSPASMRPIGEELAAGGLAVEGVRLPGHGTDLDDLRGRRWTEWVDAALEGIDVLRRRGARTVVAFGQSMGAAVVLQAVATRSQGVDGLALANPYVFDARLLAVPLARPFLRHWKGVGNDIAKPGVVEGAEDKMPVPAMAQMAELLRRARHALPSIRLPVVVFRSGTDHVIPRSNAAKVLARIGSVRSELVECPRSFHVVALDHDAPLVRERIATFATELDAARQRT